MINEITLNIRGLQIAAKVHNSDKGIPTLALHGWLDNAASFDLLAPLLPECHIVAIDLPGHGLSSHPAKSSTLHMLDIAIVAILIAKELGWDSFALLGHSLGAVISNVVAGTLHDKIKWVVAIDALGAITCPAPLSPTQFRRFIDSLLTSKPDKAPPCYNTFNDALQARLNANNMKETSARVLVERGLMQLDEGQWTWRTDPRLLMPLAQLFTEEQVLAYLQEITAPVCFIKADNGYPFPEALANARFKSLQQGKLYTLPGQHHVHLDSPELVADTIHTFLKTL